jgi:hypothetical protein
MPTQDDRNDPPPSARRPRPENASTPRSRLFTSSQSRGTIPGGSSPGLSEGSPGAKGSSIAEPAAGRRDEPHSHD